MSYGSCEEFASDPTRFALHTDDCAACRKLVEDLESVDQMIAGESIDPRQGLVTRNVDVLPMASWEGADHKPWPVAVAVLALVGVAAAALFLLGGVAPLRGIADAVSQPFRAVSGLLHAAPVLGELMNRSPAGMRLLLLVAFAAVNIVLFRLLRRAPRGVE